MPFAMEYSMDVKCRSHRSNLASTACFAIILLPALAASAIGQFNTAAGSNTHAVSVAPPTGAVAPPTGSLAPRTGPVAPPTGLRSSSPDLRSSNFPHSHPVPQEGAGNHHRRHGSDELAYPYFYGIPVPYAADLGPDDSGPGPDADLNASDQPTNDDAEGDYQPGPTVLDHRRPGSDSYISQANLGPGLTSDQERDASVAPSADPSEESSQLPTTLVFKDGHQLVVENYAIVGETLYDLTPGHARKVALAGIDLPATEKQNDDRGVVFQLPPSASGN